jgi:hypothetical protein
MTRYSSKSMDEVPLKHTDEAKRRTRPEDHRPWSPKAIDRLYAKGKESPSLGDKSDKAYRNQFVEDRHGPGYENDTKGWSRGGDLGGDGRPGFDGGKLDIANKPQKARGPKCEASGQDMHKSPFSAAYRKGSGEGF